MFNEEKYTNGIEHHYYSDIQQCLFPGFKKVDRETFFSFLRKYPNDFCPVDFGGLAVDRSRFYIYGYREYNYDWEDWNPGKLIAIMSEWNHKNYDSNEYYILDE